MPRLAVALAALVVVAGCGQGADSSGDDAGSGPATSLTITVVADRGATPNEMRLECDPTGGDHPNAQAACDRLADVGAKAFDPVPADQACTMIFGGPQTATIQGSLDGETVDATFSRSNGCEIDRWDTLGTEVFDVPLQ